MASRPIFGRMKNSFREVLDSSPRTYPGRDRFLSWVNNFRIPPLTVAYREYDEFRKGEPVRWEIIEAYSELVSDVMRLPKVAASEIADRLDTPPTFRGEPWTRGWEWLKEKFAGRFRLDPLAFCRTEDDVRTAAIMTVRNYGRKLQGNHLSDAEAEAAGIRAMKPPSCGYDEFLITMWRRQQRTVMFAVDRSERGKPRRVGASVVFPLTESAYARMRDGEIDVFALTPEDIAPASHHMHINAVAECPLEPGESRFQRSQAQLHVCSWQMGMMSGTIDEERGPYILAFAGSPESEARAKAYDFRPTGNEMPRTGRRMLELAPRRKPNGQRPERSAPYKAMCVLLMAYQTFNEDERVMIKAGY